VVCISGATCSQFFSGMTSFYTDVVGMQSDSEGPTALKTFIRQIGAPFAMKNYNSKMQTGKAFTALLLVDKYRASSSLAEPS